MYKDRGIIKWQPFDALTGFRDSINNMLYNKNKKEKPILLEDKLDEMDYILTEAINNKREVIFTYYEKGYFKTIYDYINNVCFINKVIILKSSIKLNIEDVTNLELI